MRPQQTLLCLVYVKKYFHIEKRRSQQMMMLWRSDEKIMLVLLKVSRKGVQYHEKAQLLSFDSWIMRYPPSRLCNCYWLKNFTLIKILSFIINRFCLSCFFSFFLWLFYSYDYRDNSQLVFFSNKFFIQILYDDAKLGES